MTPHKGEYPADVRARLDADAREIVSRYPQARSALLPLLHLVQSEDGYISPAGIHFCAEVLGLAQSSVSAVATFYSQYKRRPNGDYTVGVCTNTLCAVMGGDIIFDRLSEHLDIGHDETTEDGKITLERLECNAACDFAPVMMINWEFFDNQTPASAVEVVDAILAGEDVRPTRGSDRVATFKETSRVLAGFDDGRANEGTAGGPATMVGLELARSEGWHAPGYSASGGTRRPEADDGEPDVGEAGSSADRPPVSAGDVSASGPGDPEPRGAGADLDDGGVEPAADGRSPERDQAQEGTEQ
ncbi:NADH-quinone oxidoreductase subunit NuoE [Pseudactinotalea sp. Z1748]|uniref:NADH-quinone oxidoreductase subunit NuoE n=1 Tax=Pseudactinotalea sp. Z1748 TaxID=3413027 RepID=UPI003C7E34AF